MFYLVLGVGYRIYTCVKIPKTSHLRSVSLCVNDILILKPKGWVKSRRAGGQRWGRSRVRGGPQAARPPPWEGPRARPRGGRGHAAPLHTRAAAGPNPGGGGMRQRHLRAPRAPCASRPPRPRKTGRGPARVGGVHCPHVRSSSPSAIVPGVGPSARARVWPEDAGRKRAGGGVSRWRGDDASSGHRPSQLGPPARGRREPRRPLAPHGACSWRSLEGGAAISCPFPPTPHASIPISPFGGLAQEPPFQGAKWGAQQRGNGR